MAKRMRYGPRWNGGSVSYTSGPNIGMPLHPMPHRLAGKKRSLQAKVMAAQAISTSSREARGLGPTLPTFNFEKPKPPDEVFKANILRAAEEFINGAAEKIILEQGGYALVLVRKQGKPKTVCVNMTTGKAEWVE